MTDVAKYQTENGGSVQHGWTIWESPGILLEAEFHADWRSPSGDLIDVTPKLDGEEEILFLPDSKRVYEHKLVGNIRRPLSRSPEVLRMIETSERIFQIKSKHFRNDEVDMAAVLSELQTPPRASAVSAIGRNQRCPCGSGLKYKKCCGRSPRLLGNGSE